MTDGFGPEGVGSGNAFPKPDDAKLRGDGNIATFNGAGHLSIGELALILSALGRFYPTQFIKGMGYWYDAHLHRYNLDITLTREAYPGQYDGKSYADIVQEAVEERPY